MHFRIKKSFTLQCNIAQEENYFFICQDKDSFFNKKLNSMQLRSY